MRVVRRAAISAVLLACLTAEARADLELIATGTFDTGTTVGTTTLAAPAAYSLEAIFDPASGIEAMPCEYLYAFTSMTIGVAGVGTIAPEPSGGTYIFLTNPDAGGVSIYEAGVSDVTNLQGFGSGYTTSSDPSFVASSPTPTVFGGYTDTAMLPYSFPLVGGGVLANPGTFVINTAGATAEVVAVGMPEPSALALMGMGAIGAVGARWFGRRRASTVA